MPARLQPAGRKQQAIGGSSISLCVASRFPIRNSQILAHARNPADVLCSVTSLLSSDSRSNPRIRQLSRMDGGSFWDRRYNLPITHLSERPCLIRHFLPCTVSSRRLPRG